MELLLLLNMFFNVLTSMAMTPSRIDDEKAPCYLDGPRHPSHLLAVACVSLSLEQFAGLAFFTRALAPSAEHKGCAWVREGAREGAGETRTGNKVTVLEWTRLQLKSHLRTRDQSLDVCTNTHARTHKHAHSHTRFKLL